MRNSGAICGCAAVAAVFAWLLAYSPQLPSETSVHATPLAVPVDDSFPVDADPRVLADQENRLPVRTIVTGVDGRLITVAPGTRGGVQPGMEFRAFRGSRPKSESQWLGAARVQSADERSAVLEVLVDGAEVNDFLISDQTELSPAVYLPRAEVTQRPDPPRPVQSSIAVELTALVQPAGREVVSFGVPFPPGVLRDAAHLAVFLGETELPVAARVLAPWRTDGKNGSPRSVLVQFELDFSREPQRTVHVRWDRPRTRHRDKLVPVTDLLVTKSKWTKIRESIGKVDVDEPRVQATLPADWLCASWAAGPQVPIAENRWLPEVDSQLRTLYEGVHGSEAQRAANLSGDFAEQQLDRTILLYRLYFRTGDPAIGLDAYRHATFYRNCIVTKQKSPRARGGFLLKHSDQELANEWIDPKYAYAEGLAVHYLLTGDERCLTTIEDVCALWDSEFGEFIRDDYTQKPHDWNERFCAIAWLAKLHAYEVTGHERFLHDARQQCDNVYRMQFEPSDGHLPDGSWRHSSTDHGEDAEDGEILGSSVWMSALLVDAIFQHWLLTGDERCPHMLTAYCEFAERYGIHWFNWTDPSQGISRTARWPVPWYFASSISAGKGEGAEDDHNIETGYLFLMGYYFRRDPRYLYWGRELIRTSRSRMHPRMFNWSYKASQQAAWFLQEAGVPVTSP